MGVSTLKAAFKALFEASGNTADSAAQGMAEAIITEIEDPAGATVLSVNGRTGAVVLAKTDVGLGNVDNTSDLNKPVSTATQSALDGKAALLHGHGEASTTTSGFMSALDKVKLNGVETGANNYSHPATHPPSIIVQDASNRFVTDAEKSAWNGKENSISKSTGILSWTGSAWSWLTDVAGYVASLAWSKLTSIPTLISDLATLGRGTGWLKGNGAGLAPSWGTPTPAEIGAAPASHGTHVPNGGSTGQVLSKASNADGDLAWAGAPTPSAADLLDAIKTVDGSGSGLDADLLDGKHAADFVLSGNLSNNKLSTDAPSTYPLGTSVFLLTTGLDAGWPNVGVTEAATVFTVKAANARHFQFVTAKHTGHIWLRVSLNSASSDEWGPFYKMWNEATDGAGSGLDADTVDGFHLAEQAGMGGTFTSGTQTYTVGSMAVNEFRLCTGGWSKTATSTSGTVNIKLPAGGTYQVQFMTTGPNGSPAYGSYSGGGTLYTYTNSTAFSGSFAIWIRRLS